MIDGLSRETLAAQALGEIDQASGALSPAIHPSTIYERSPDGTYRSGLAYTRADNPTYDHAERLLAALEGGVACMHALRLRQRGGNGRLSVSPSRGPRPRLADSLLGHSQVASGVRSLVGA